MAASGSSKSTSVSFTSMRFGVDSLVGFLGFSAFVAAIVCQFVTVPALVAETPEGFVLVRVVCTLAMIVASAAVRIGSFFIATHKNVLLVVGACIGALSLAVVLLVPHPSLGLACACFAVTGFGFGVFAPQWFGFICVQPTKMVPLSVAGGLTAGLLVVLLMELLIGEGGRFLLVVLQAVPVLAMLFLMRAVPDKALSAAIPNKESDKRSKIMRTSVFMLVTNHFEIGFVISIAVALDQTIFCLAAAALFALVNVIDCGWKRCLNERNLSRIVPPVTTAAFTMMLLFGDTVRLIALCALMFMCVTYTVSGYAAMSEHVRISRLAPLRVFGTARVYDNIGMAVGFACGAAVMLLAATDMWAAVQAMAVVGILYAFITAFNHQARFPEANLEVETSEAADSMGMWRKRCKALSDRCSLSARQFEVLVLIAQGRNAKYIEQALMISLSTAQTHIRNIYRKVGVHSRQELLDLIEETKLYGED